MVAHFETPEAVDEFRDILSDWIDVYKYRLCSYFATKNKQEVRFVSGQVLFETETPGNVAPFYFENKNIIAGREISNIERENIHQLL